jgi:GNAT superfamily N-acetyltransferase
LKYKIAPLRLDEHARWMQLWLAYQRFYDVELPASVTEYTWQGLHNGRLHGLGARNSADELLGIVHFLFHEDTWSSTPACYLQDLYVDPSARGTGCGRQLIAAVADSARAAGANHPYWLTHQSNTAARTLYERVGRNLGFIQYVYTPQQPAGGPK